MNIAHVIFKCIITSGRLYAVRIFSISLLLTTHLSSHSEGLPKEPTSTTFIKATNKPLFFADKYLQNNYSIKRSGYFRDGVTVPQLDITLLKNSGAPLFIPADSVRLNFEDYYNNNIDTGDVVKTVFPQSNLSISKYGLLLSAEKRTKLVVTDTIFLKLGNVVTNSYRLEIDPSVLANPQMQAIIKDNYLQAETTVSLTAVTNIDFNVTADAASSAGNRFYIFFRPYIVAGALPITFINMEATVNDNKTNAVRWKVAIELNLHHYETETSINGIVFTKFGNNVFSTGNGNAANYEQTDMAPAKGLIYYRIKAISTNGEWVYSNIVKLSVTDKYIPIQVYPNPVSNKSVNLIFNNRAGFYTYFIVDQQGKIIGSGQLKVAKNIQKKNIILNANITTGMYQLHLINENVETRNIAIFLL